MTRQLFLTIGAERLGPPGSLEKSRQVISNWLTDKGIDTADSFFDNGSGLSRKSVLTNKIYSLTYSTMQQSILRLNNLWNPSRSPASMVPCEIVLQIILPKANCL